MITRMRTDSAANRVELATRPDKWKVGPCVVADKRVVITGGTSGIGRTTALLLASLGAKVLIFGRHEDKLEEALQDCEPYRKNVIGLSADVSDEEQIDKVFEAVDKKLDGIDILINNAAVAPGSIEDTEPDDYRYAIKANVLGYMSCANRALKRMKAGGRIINVGSLSAKSRGPGSDIYVTTKSALRGFSDSLGQQAQDDGIYVTLIEPGLVGSDLTMGDKSASEEREKLQSGEMLVSECIAESILNCLTLPEYCWVPLLQIQPIHQHVPG